MRQNALRYDWEGYGLRLRVGQLQGLAGAGDGDLLRGGLVHQLLRLRQVLRGLQVRQVLRGLLHRQVLGRLLSRQVLRGLLQVLLLRELRRRVLVRLHQLLLHHSGLRPAAHELLPRRSQRQLRRRHRHHSLTSSHQVP